MKKEILVRFNAKNFFLVLLLSLLASCNGQLQDPSTLTVLPKPGDFFESWDPDQVTAPGANLITFTGGDSETTFPYYSKSKSYPIKFKVNTGGLPAGVVDPGIYSAKIEYSDNNGSTWTTITGASNLPVTAGNITTFNWTLPAGLADGSLYLIRLTARSVSGDSTIVTSSQNFIIDSSGPTITNFDLTLGSLGVANATTINRSFFSFSVQASDVLTPIKFYCLKTDGSSIPPVETDDCWQDLGTSAGTNINLSNQPAFIGFVAGAYQLRLWVQDSASNISTLSAGVGVVGVDRIDVAYNPATAPEITNVIISNNNSASLNPTNGQLSFTAGQNVYVRWKAVDSDLTSNPISINTTTDEKTFISVDALQNITNANQGGCTTDVNYTGCAVFAAPTSGYFRVQVGAIDQTGLISKGGSIAANMSNFSLLAGNTDVGLNGSANKAIFINKTRDNSSTPQTGILAVTKRGKVFYLDNDRGILVVDPQDGTQKIYISKSTTSFGDGGNYTLAKTANTVKITLDYQDRLLILETDRIRRVETNGIINTIVGGGSKPYDNITKTSIKADEFKLALPITSGDVSVTKYLFQVLPNGHIWFSLNHSGTYNNDNGNLFAIFKPSDNKVYFLGLKGNGVYGDPTYDLQGNGLYLLTSPALTFDYRTSQVKYLSMYFCKPVPGGCGFYGVNFNPRTGQNVGYGTHYRTTSYWGTDSYIASRKGDLYDVSRLYPAVLFKLNSSTLLWDKVIGATTPSNGSTGTCADDTLATACGVDLADAFISENKTVYFVDRGGIIRVVLPNGKIKTLFGQSLSYGDNGAPNSARLGLINWMGVWDSTNKVVVYDESQSYIREFSNGVGDTIQKLCGTGEGGAPTFNASAPYLSVQNAVDKPCFGGYWSSNSLGMAVDRRNGEVYSSLSGRVAKILRSGANAGKWQTLVGAGSPAFVYTDPTSNNQLGTSVYASSYPISILGLMHPDTMTTSSALGAVENGSSDAFVMMSSQVWTGSKLINDFYKVGRGSDGMVRHISGTAGANENYIGGLDTVVGANFSISHKKPIYESYIESVYVQEDRSVLFGHYGWAQIIKTPVTRGALDIITGAGLISDVYAVPKAMTAFNYRWTAGRLSEIFYCGVDGTLNKFTTLSNANRICAFPKNSSNEEMFTCYGRSMHWDSTKTKLIFAAKQNGVTTIAQYDTAGCN